MNSQSRQRKGLHEMAVQKERSTESESAERLTVHVYRSPPRTTEHSDGAGSFQEFSIPRQDRMTVLNVLDHIHEHCDRSLAYYKSCRIGKCLGCVVQVNGKNRLACTTLAQDGMRIGPAKGHRTIRDLVVEFPVRHNPSESGPDRTVP